MSMLAKIREWWNDPFRIARDWDEFNEMTDEQLAEEFDKAIDSHSTSSRHRRLAQYLALKWLINRQMRKEV